MPTVLLPAPDVATRLHSLIEASGVVHALDGSEGVDVLDSAVVGAPSVDISAVAVPFRDGRRTRQVRRDSTTVELELHVSGANASVVQQRLDLLRRWLDPTRGEVRYRLRREDGEVRDLWCRMTGGLDYAYRRGYVTFQDVDVTLEALDDPYFYDTAPITATYTTGAPVGFFATPFLPVRLVSSVVLDTPVVVNDGSVRAWPVWTITGPGTDPIIRNLSTGRTIALAYSLGAGQTIIVDTRPVARRGSGVLQVRSGFGDNLWPAMTSRQLFPLEVGANHLQLELGGATSASSIALSYTRRWLGL
jgi:hypothetical protein